MEIVDSAHFEHIPINSRPLFLYSNAIIAAEAIAMIGIFTYRLA